MYKRLINTEHLYFGIGPQSVGTRDLVCSVCGYSVPMVPREIVSTRECYKVIGEAYVHNIKNGKPLTSNDDRKTAS
jgi:hypothetical protein